MNTEKFTIIITGGIGRVICAIPSLEAFVKTHPNTRIVTYATSIFIGNRLLEDKVYEFNHKNIFQDWIKDSKILNPEPYTNQNYYNQRSHLITAFAEELGVTLKSDHISLEVTKVDENTTIPAIKFAKSFGFKETVVVQPVGATYNPETNIDPSGRSLSMEGIREVLLYLASKFNLVVMGSTDCFDNPEQWYTPKDFSIRDWNMIIASSDYFIGCDSVGQHLARNANIPGTVILGTTFQENVTYPEWFNILEYYEDINLKKYQPIRILEDTPEYQVPSEVMRFPTGFLVSKIKKHMDSCNILGGLQDV
jgi:ADP-heptose:LPS heptosyltransferase